jgi:hypothetical protein
MTGSLLGKSHREAEGKMSPSSTRMDTDKDKRHLTDSGQGTWITALKEFDYQPRLAKIDTALRDLCLSASICGKSLSFPGGKYSFLRGTFSAFPFDLSLSVFSGKSLHQRAPNPRLSSMASYILRLSPKVPLNPRALF